MNINTLQCCVTCYKIHNLRTVYHYCSQWVQRMSQHNSKDRYYADLPLELSINKPWVLLTLMLAAVASVVTSSILHVQLATRESHAVCNRTFSSAVNQDILQHADVERYQTVPTTDECVSLQCWLQQLASYLNGAVKLATDVELQTASSGGRETEQELMARLEIIRHVDEAAAMCGSRLLTAAAINGHPQC